MKTTFMEQGKSDNCTFYNLIKYTDYFSFNLIVWQRTKRKTSKAEKSTNYKISSVEMVSTIPAFMSTDFLADYFTRINGKTQHTTQRKVYRL